MNDKEIREVTPEQETEHNTVTQETVRLNIPEVVEVEEHATSMEKLAVERELQDTVRMAPVHPAEPAADEFDLDSIMKEFGGASEAAPEEEKPMQEDQLEEEAPAPAQEKQPENPPQATSDTVRLDTLEVEKKAKAVRFAAPITEEQDREPFSEQWEPEYEQPMGEYVPPQPIAFRPRSRIRELKQQLVAGPEKRYYELAEKGLGKLQFVIFLSFLVVLLSAGSTVMYAMGMVQENRLKLIVFGQCFAMLLSALMGSNQLIEGVADVFKGRFTTNTMLVVTFVLCCLDGVLGLQQLRVPCCAAFSLVMTMSLGNAYQRRDTEMGQMDTLRKAVRLDAVCVSSDYYQGRNGLLRRDGELADFMDNYKKPSVPEKVICWYALAATLVSLGIAVVSYVFYGDIFISVQVASVCLLAAMPASIFVTLSRPKAILQRRLHSVGTVLCGWQGIKRLARKSVFPVEYADLFPVGSARMNGVKFFGSRPTDEVVAYCTALISANNSGLAPLFNQVLESRNGYHYECRNLCCYDNGGIGGEVKGEAVLVGSMSFLKEMGVEIPSGMRVNQAICVAIEGELCGLFALTFENARTAAEGLAILCSGRGSNPILATDDFLLSQSFIRSRFGVNPRKLRFPEHTLRKELQSKQPDEGAPAVMLVTREGLAAYACGVSGAKALRTASTLGVVVHMLGGILGLAIMVLLTMLGRWDLLTPVNMFAYQLVWMIPGLLITEWTRFG